jgi:selenide,water dikinase
MTRAAPRRHLLLVGGGHAHLHVLLSLAADPLPGAAVTLISPESYATYSGMVPGALAGLYDLADAQVDLRALCARAGVRFVADQSMRIDAVSRLVECRTGATISYDVLSLDIGSVPAGSDDPAVRRHAVPVKPLAHAIDRIVAFGEDARRGGEPRRAVVVGGGAGGVEVAFAVARRLTGARDGRVVVVDRHRRPLPGYPARVSDRIERLFRARHIEYVGGVEVDRLEAGRVHLKDRNVLTAGLVLWATSAAGPPLLGASGLPLDGNGFLRVGDDLRCGAHADILAAGDCATIDAYPTLPKAGVYAVRQGPILAHNLRAALNGDVFVARYRPQRRFLSLVGTGDGRAVLSYYGLVLDGRWVWRLKEWIDRRWVDRHGSPARRTAARPPSMPRRAGPAAGAAMRPCGGCAAKVGAEVLGRVLGRLPRTVDDRVVIGLDRPDDAAVTTHPAGQDVVTTVDFFPPFLDDPLLVGEVAAVNAASDVYAMGGEPRAATALISLPRGDEPEIENTLELVLRGGLRGLAGMQVALVGGHTVEGESLLVGFAFTGSVDRAHMMTKGGARPGDALVLSKPLGTGVILAAARMGMAPAAWVDAAAARMRTPNRDASRVLRAAGVRACTDVTGFGFGRHLVEMLTASDAAARIDLQCLPALAGAVALLGAGWRSSCHSRNARATASHLQPASDGARRGAAYELLFDPQTSGGLLAAVPPASLAAIERALRDSGVECHVVGEIVAGRSGNIDLGPRT